MSVGSAIYVTEVIGLSVCELYMSYELARAVGQPATFVEAWCRTHEHPHRSRDEVRRAASTTAQPRQLEPGSARRRYEALRAPGEAHGSLPSQHQSQTREEPPFGAIARKLRPSPRWSQSWVICASTSKAVDLVMPG